MRVFVVVFLIVIPSFCEVIIRRDLPDVTVGVEEFVSIEININDIAVDEDSSIQNLRYSIDMKLPSWLRKKESLLVSPPGHYHQLINESYSQGSYDVVVENGIAYVADYDGGLLVVDFSPNISEPVLRNQIKTSEEFCYVAVKIVGDRLYSLTESGVVEIFDISRKSRPDWIGSELVLEGITAKQLAIDEAKQLIYVVGESGGVSGICSIDISDEEDPVQVDCVVLDGTSCEDLTIIPQNGDIYTSSSGTTHLNIVTADASGNLNMNIFIKPGTDGLQPYSVVMRDDLFFFVGTENCLYIYKWEIIFNRKGFICSDFGTNTKVSLFGEDYVLVNGVNGVYLIDVSTTNSPKIAYTFPHYPAGVARNGIFVEKNTVYLPIITNGVYAQSVTGILLEGTNDCVYEEVGMEEGEESVEIVVRASETDLIGSYTDEEFSLEYGCAAYVIPPSTGEEVRGEYAKDTTAAIVTIFLLLALCACCCGVGLLCACICCGIVLLLLLTSFGGSVVLSLGYNFAIRNRSRKSKEILLGGGEEQDKVEKIIQESLNSEKKDMAAIHVNEKLFEIKYDDIEVIKMIGQGGSKSVVFYGKWKSKEIAFKCFKTSDLMVDGDNFSEFEKEVEVMSSVRHPYCLQFFGCSLKPPRVGIVMEYCENGDIKSYLTENPAFPANERIRVLGQIADGMEYLHERNVIHRDLKCENILLDKNLDAKIMDFGVSKIYEQANVEKTKSVGTSYYMAPEVVKGKEYDLKCDVFSFSIVMWEVLSNDFKPYGKLGVMNIEYKVSTDEKCRPEIGKIGANIRKRYSKVIEMIKMSWKGNPNERPTFAELKEVLLSV